MNASSQIAGSTIAAGRALGGGRAASLVTAALNSSHLRAASLTRAARWVDELVAMTATVGPLPDWRESLADAVGDGADTGSAGRAGPAGRHGSGAPASTPGSGAGRRRSPAERVREAGRAARSRQRADDDAPGRPSASARSGEWNKRPRRGVAAEIARDRRTQGTSRVDLTRRAVAAGSRGAVGHKEAAASAAARSSRRDPGSTAPFEPRRVHVAGGSPDLPGTRELSGPAYVPVSGSSLAVTAARAAQRLRAAAVYGWVRHGDAVPAQTGWAGRRADAVPAHAHAPAHSDEAHVRAAGSEGTEPYAGAPEAPAPSLAVDRVHTAEVLAALGAALCSEWDRRVDGERAPAQIIAALQGRRVFPSAVPATDRVPGERTGEDAVPVAARPETAPGFAARSRRGAQEGPAARAARERQAVTGSAAVPRAGSVIPLEHANGSGATPAAVVHAQSTSGEAAPGTVGAGADPFEDLDDLAERVGTILREEARRSGIDV